MINDSLKVDNTDFSVLSISKILKRMEPEQFENTKGKSFLKTTSVKEKNYKKTRKFRARSLKYKAIIK